MMPTTRSGTTWRSALAACCLGTGTLELVGVSWLPRPEWAFVWWGAATAFLGWELRRSSATPARVPRWSTALAGLLYVFAAFLVPDEWRWVLGLAAAGALSEIILPSGARFPSPVWGRALHQVAASAVVAWGAVSLASQFVLRFPTVPGVAPGLAGVLRILGLRTAAFEDNVVLMTLHDVQTVPMSWSNLAVFLLVAIWVGYAMLRWLSLRDDAHRPTPRSVTIELAILAVVLSVVAVLRMLLAFAMAVQFESAMDFDVQEWPVGFLVSPSLQGLLFALAVPPLITLFGLRSGHASVSRAPRFGRGLGAIATGCAAFLVAFFMNWEEDGERLGGRILIDEGHSRWETVEPEYDTDWYGYDSGYNYAGILAYMRHFYTVTVHRGALDAEALQDIDILFLKIPTEGHEQHEIDAVVDFVRRGGSVFLVGEHTNVWGSAFYLNNFARRFGFRFRNDVVFDFRQKFEQVHHPSELARHPILSSVREFLFAVSCSITPLSPAVRPVIMQSPLWSLSADYAVDNFYPPANLDFESLVNPHTQMVCRHFGAGRVAGFTDSTVWSNFSAMLPGKPELLLGTLEWLNHRNRFPDPFPMARALLLLVVAVGLFSFARWPQSATLTLAAALVAWFAGVRVAGSVNLATHALPQPDAAYREVAFLEAPAVYDLPTWGFSRAPHRSFSIFYQWILRLGVFPRFVRVSEAVPETASVLVAVAGSAEVPTSDRQRMDEALARGIPVLLLVRRGTDASVSDYLKSHGLHLEEGDDRDTSRLHTGPDLPSWDIPWTWGHTVSGGESVLTADDGSAILQRAASAPLYVFLGAERFTDPWMGTDQGNVPDPDLRRHFELEFSVFRGLLQADIDKELQEAATRDLSIESNPAAVTTPIDRPAKPHHD